MSPLASLAPAATATTPLVGGGAGVKEDIQELAIVGIHEVRMMFFPKLWDASPTVNHTWIDSVFPPNRHSDIPKEPGVYVFVVMPKLFNFPYQSGLFYVGKATNLYERIGAYISEDGRRFLRTNRPLVWKMLNVWHGHLRYFYTTTAGVAEAEQLEEQMLKAFVPPFNSQYEATISQAMRAFP